MMQTILRGIEAGEEVYPPSIPIVSRKNNSQEFIE